MRVRTPLRHHGRPPRTGVRRPLRLVLAAGLLAGLVVTGPGAPASPAAAGPAFGRDPLDDVLHWATEEARCGLTPNQLAALVLAPTYPETGTPVGATPSPMTLSRWDNQIGLHSFRTVRGQPRAFWHPGIGAWQFDSAGMGARLTAAQAIDTNVAAAHTARAIAARWCANPTLAHVWAPWYGCAGRACHKTYYTIYRRKTDRLVAVTPDLDVQARGGMQRRTCIGPARRVAFTCWRVDPSRAQGHAAFAAPRYGPAPISAPFYVYAANGREYRHWLRADTGYGRGVWASRPLGANARTGLTWHYSDGLVDVTRSRRR